MESENPCGRGHSIEPHKCIKCELCIQIAARAGEPLGLTFVGRGFDVELAAPFDRSIEEGIANTATDCVAACPTGALSFLHDSSSDLKRLRKATPKWFRGFGLSR